MHLYDTIKPILLFIRIQCLLSFKLNQLLLSRITIMSTKRQVGHIKTYSQKRIEVFRQEPS
jgi:hypothetical protein